MALAGVKLQILVTESDAFATGLTPCAVKNHCTPSFFCLSQLKSFYAELFKKQKPLGG